MSFGSRNSKDTSAYMLFYKNKSTCEMELEASTGVPTTNSLTKEQEKLEQIKAEFHT